MITKISLALLALVIPVALSCSVVNSSSSGGTQSTPTTSGTPVPRSVNGEQTAVFAGGCFWGVEAVFETLKGVSDVRSGYAGGTASSANYDDVSSGTTDHAEAVALRFDPSVISYKQLLEIFFSVAHDPTQLNRQGPDVGRQYRSAVFVTGDEQKQTVQQYLESLKTSKTFAKKIETEITPLKEFYPAEPYHQDFMKKNPDHPYIVQHDVPKVEALKKQFPELVKN